MKIHSVALLLTILLPAAISVWADEPSPVAPPMKNTDGFTNTPIIPGTTWHVHDPNRPQPEIVTPGSFSTQEAPGKPPSDAIVLFDGTDVSEWRDAKGEPAKWKVEKNELIESKGDIFSKKEFGDV